MQAGMLAPVEKQLLHLTFAFYHCKMRSLGLGKSNEQN